MAAVIDAVEYELIEDHHREAVAAVAPPHMKFDGEVWAELSSAIYDFLAERQRRIRRNPQAERERWRRIDKHITKLAGEVRAIKRRALWNEPEAAWADEFLIALLRAKQGAVPQIDSYSTRARFPRSNIDVFYGCILRVWTGMGGKLSYSKPAGARGEPFGRLVDFFAAVVNPVLRAEAPSRHAIAKIIDRERQRRTARNRTNGKTAREK
jgi:hypothetical protein